MSTEKPKDLGRPRGRNAASGAFEGYRENMRKISEQISAMTATSPAFEGYRENMRKISEQISAMTATSPAFEGYRDSMRKATEQISAMTATSPAFEGHRDSMRKATEQISAMTATSPGFEGYQENMRKISEQISAMTATSPAFEDYRENMRKVSEQLTEAMTATGNLDALASAWESWAQDLSALADEVEHGDLEPSEAAGVPEVLALISGLVVLTSLVGFKLTELARLGPDPGSLDRFELLSDAQFALAMAIATYVWVLKILRKKH
jgi:soluble cytochrome b562